MRLIVKATVCEQVNVMDYTGGYRMTGHSSKGEKDTLLVRAAAYELVK